MRKTRCSVLSIALGLVVSQASFAAFPDYGHISSQCRLVIEHLKALTHGSRDVCRGDVDIAAAYITAAHTKIKNHTLESALVSLYQGKHELHDIAYSRPHCKDFAPLVKTDLAKVIEIISDVEVMGRIKA